MGTAREIFLHVKILEGRAFAHPTQAAGRSGRGAHCALRALLDDLPLSSIDDPGVAEARGFQRHQLG